jgi:non-ribosomal peptide synthetase component E (peptide arylation enzyme)
VASVAIVGYPDKEMGERCCACVMVKTGQTLTFDEMVSFLKGKKLAMFKLPEKMVIMDGFPIVGDSGKIDKKVLKKDIEEKVLSGKI